MKDPGDMYLPATAEFVRPGAVAQFFPPHHSHDRTVPFLCSMEIKRTQHLHLRAAQNEFSVSRPADSVQDLLVQYAITLRNVLHCSSESSARNEVLQVVKQDDRIQD